MQVRYQAALRPDPGKAYYPSPLILSRLFCFPVILPSRAPEIVFDPLYVVLPKVFPPLDFDQDEILLPYILNAVKHVCRDIDGCTLTQAYLLFPESHEPRSANHMPVLRTKTMPLQAHPLPGEYDEPFHLVVLFV